MSAALHDLTGRVAYLKRSVDLLLSRLDDVDGLGGVSLDSLADSLVANANDRWADAVTDHIELAIQHAEGWHAAVREVVGP
jgi:hypothetical protein